MPMPSDGEGNGNPLQGSCLENPTDRGAWRTIKSTGSQRIEHDLAPEHACPHNLYPGKNDKPLLLKPYFSGSLSSTPAVVRGRNMHEMKEGKTHLFWVNSVRLCHTSAAFVNLTVQISTYFLLIFKKRLGECRAAEFSHWQLVIQAPAWSRDTDPASWGSGLGDTR